MEAFKEISIKYHNLDGFIEIKEPMELYTIDRYDSLLFKLAEFVQVPPSDIYCTIEEKKTTYTLWQYFIGGHQCNMETPAQLRTLENDDKYTNFSRIPIEKIIFDQIDDPGLTNRFKLNKSLLGEFLTTTDPIEIDMMTYEDFGGKHVNMDNIVEDGEASKVIKLGFTDKYFPFKGFLRESSKEWVKIENKLQTDRVEFYKEEQKIFSNHIKKMDLIKEWETKYFIRYIDYTLSFANQKFDLKNMFNHLILKGTPQIDNLGYYFIENSSWFVAFKSLNSAEKPYEKSPGFELISGESGLIGFKINESGEITLRLEVGELFDSYPDQEFFDQKLMDIELFFDRINKIYYKFSKKKLKKESAQSQMTIRYTSFTHCELDEIKGQFDEFIKLIEKSTELFNHDKNLDSYNTYLASHGEEIVKFNLDNDVFEMEYNGDVSYYGEVFTEIMVILMIGQNVNMNNVSGEQTSLLSKRLLKNDPVLFGNLIDNIYSRICEGLREPEFVGPEKKNDPYVYKYWNFTTNEPEYYKCNSQFKYLSFKVGEHKENMCIPCCSNTNPVLTKKRKEVYENCMENREATKEKTESKYIFRNINKFMVGRYTAINVEFEQYIGKNMYIYCETMPADRVEPIEIVTSLVRSISYLIDYDIDKLLEELENFYRAGIESEEFINEMTNLREKSLFEDYNVQEWRENLTEMISKMYNYNLFFLETKHNGHNIAYIDIENEHDLIIRQSGDIFNPVVRIKGNDAIKVQESDRSIGFAAKELERDRVDNDIERVKFIIEQNKGANIMAQMLNERGLCKYVICKLESKKHILLPLVASIPMSDIPAAKAIDPQLIKNYASCDEVFAISEEYSGEIEYLFSYDRLIRGFVKNNLMFYLSETTKDKLPKELQEISVVQWDYDPITINITIFNKFNFNRDAYYQALMSIYETHIYELIEMCSLETLNISQNTSTVDVEAINMDDVKKEIKPTDEKHIINKIKEKLNKLSNKSEIDEMGTLYTCKKNPNEFFCDDQKLLITPEMERLLDLLSAEIEEGEFDIAEFAKGLFVMVGKFEFKQGPGEFLEVRELITKE